MEAFSLAEDLKLYDSMEREEKEIMRIDEELSTLNTNTDE